MTAPTPRRSAREQARLDAALTDLFETKITFNQVIGMKVDSLDPQDARLSFRMRPELVGHHLSGRLHGGVISSALDALAGLALMSAIGEKHAAETADQVMHRFARFGTIDMRIDFLRPGIGQEFHASAQVTRLGGRVGSALMRLVNEQGLLIATGAASYIVS